MKIDYIRLKNNCFMLSFLNDTKIILFFISLFYIFVYLSLNPTPGNSPFTHPIGWWGWFDQGEYIKSSLAIVNFDFSPGKHYYPPLYPAAGSLFLSWSNGHPYFLFNLLCLLWFSYVFIRFSEIYTSRSASIFILLGTTIFNLRIFENFVIPWTTTLATALLSTIIYGFVLLNQTKLEYKRINLFHIFIIALSLGLLAPTRPADAVVGAVIGSAFFVTYIFSSKQARNRVPSTSSFLLISFFGLSIGPIIFLGFNYLVFGNFLGGYAKSIGGNGFLISDLLEKFISIWLDSNTIYHEPSSSLTDIFPWLYFSLAGIAWILIKGDLPLRGIALSILVLFLIYLPYGDLLPNGIWRYYNVHYFKWTFPFLGLFAWLLAVKTFSNFRDGYFFSAPFFISTLIPLFLLCLGLTISSKPINNLEHNKGTLKFDFPNTEVDFLDIKGISGDFNSIYFGEHRVWVDGTELKRVRDFRLLPTSFGVRLLFIRPIYSNNITFNPDPKLTTALKTLAANSGAYNVSFKIPIFTKSNSAHIPISNYILGQTIDFSLKGEGELYALHGWSSAEQWGRWSVGDQAKIALVISNYIDQPVTLRLHLRAFVNLKHPCQSINIFANQFKIDPINICLHNNGGEFDAYDFVLPRGTIAKDGVLKLLISTPQSISPQSLSVNNDSRVLGIGLKSLQVLSSPI